MRTLVAANWKLNKDLRQCIDYVDSFNSYFRDAQAEVLVCPPFPFVYYLVKNLHPVVKLGAQDISLYDHGAYTGEVSASMVRSVGCLYTILGHCERRKYFMETDLQINTKVKLARQYSITPIICVGETLAQRKNGKAKDMIKKQILACTNGVSAPTFVIAYEPVWAIGTGKNATPELAEEMHAFIRSLLAKKYKAKAKEVRIIYGGSVNAENATSLIRKPNINGFLVGSASLDPKQFNTIIQKCGN